MLCRILIVSVFINLLQKELASAEGGELKMRASRNYLLDFFSHLQKDWPDKKKFLQKGISLFFAKNPRILPSAEGRNYTSFYNFCRTFSRFFFWKTFFAMLQKKKKLYFCRNRYSSEEEKYFEHVTICSTTTTKTALVIATIIDWFTHYLDHQLKVALCSRQGDWRVTAWHSSATNLSAMDKRKMWGMERWENERMREGGKEVKQRAQAYNTRMCLPSAKLSESSGCGSAKVNTAVLWLTISM